MMRGARGERKCAGSLDRGLPVLRSPGVQPNGEAKFQERKGDFVGRGARV
jgi:hypothetical protein